MSNSAKRLLTAALIIAWTALPAFAIVPKINDNAASIGCVNVSTLGNIQFESEKDASGTPGTDLNFRLKLGDNWVLRGIEILDTDKRPVEFDITGIYNYSFTVPEGGASILARSEDHAAATRAGAVVELWELADKPIVEYLMTYSDVSADADYYEAICWAESEGIISVSEYFSPDDPITREELAVIIYRRALTLGLETDDASCIQLDAVDRDSVSEWAIDAVRWNVAYGVMNEFSGASGYFNPQEHLTQNDLYETICKLIGLNEANDQDVISTTESSDVLASEGGNDLTENDSVAKEPVVCPLFSQGN